MSDEALEFAAKLSHLEKSTLRGMANGDACGSGCASLLAELGLASGPDEKGIYVLSSFGQDVLACFQGEIVPSSELIAADEALEAPESPSPSGG